MSNERAKSSRLSQFDSLLLEAGAVSARFRSQQFRAHGALCANKTYLPDANEIGAARAFAARAIRDCLRALNSVSSDDARERIASAMRDLIAAVRIEQPKPKREASEVATPYWVEK